MLLSRDALWLLSWLILHQLWKQRQVPFPRVLEVTLVLLGTLPSFAKVFGGG